MPLGIGLMLVWFSIGKLSSEERNELWNQIINANQNWIWLSILISIISHLSRAYRWGFLLKPLGYQSNTLVNFCALMVGYTTNLVIPRSGEFIKTGLVSKHSKIPYQKLFGTVITERLLDLVMLLLIVCIGFLINTQLLLQYIETSKIQPEKTLFLTGIIITVLILGFIILKKIEIAFISKFKKLFNELYEGVLSIFKLKNWLSFSFHTIFIWACYILMFYVVKFGVIGVHELEVSGVIIAFIAGAFAISTTNGGIGAYPIMVGLATTLFGINKLNGEAYGWIIWGSQTIMNLILGLASYIYLSLKSE